jgi:hypothetical protein
MFPGACGIWDHARSMRSCAEYEIVCGDEIMWGVWDRVRSMRSCAEYEIMWEVWDHVRSMRLCMEYEITLLPRCLCFHVTSCQDTNEISYCRCATSPIFCTVHIVWKKTTPLILPKSSCLRSVFVKGYHSYFKVTGTKFLRCLAHYDL